MGDLLVTTTTGADAVLTEAARSLPSKRAWGSLCFGRVKGATAWLDPANDAPDIRRAQAMAAMAPFTTRRGYANHLGPETMEGWSPSALPMGPTMTGSSPEEPR